MNYQTCVDRIVSILRADGNEEAEADIAAYLAFPLPSEAEWADVLRETATYDDVDDAFACMAQYEMRLSRRGFRTPFESFVEEFLAIPAKIGMPAEYLPDMLRLWDLRRKH